MTMHPELEHAFNAGLSIPEVINIFMKHHSAAIEKHMDKLSVFSSLNGNHSESAFWDTWQPLFRRLPHTLILPSPKIVNDPFLSIRKALTRDIISWLCDSKRRSNVYLIVEQQKPTLHTNENTRAHLFANICNKAQRFGLPIRDNPNSLWHGIDPLMGELAAFCPSYCRILTKALVDNPGIFSLPTRTRFKKLIHEPWKALQESHPQYITAPPVVVLRWDSKLLDEELLRSICEPGSSQHSSSLLWIISIDTNLKFAMQDLLHPFPPFRYSTLPVSYKEGYADAALILHHRFSALRHKHKEMFDEDQVWPSEKQMSHLIRIVSGVAGFVEVIIHFVDWEDDGGPGARLETFLTYMVDSPSPSDERPFHALDHFFTHTLSNLPADLLSIVKQVFGIVYYGIYRVTPLELACLLPHWKDTLHTVLPQVYRLAVIRTDGNNEYNSWFRGFLENSKRSGRFYTPESESRLCIFQASLHILSHASNLTAMLNLMARGTQIDPCTYRRTTETLRLFACYTLCEFGDITAFNQAYTMSTLLRRFDFRCLAHTCDKFNLGRFMKFLRRLFSEKNSSRHIVRVQPIDLLDMQFIEKCDGFAEPLDLEEEQLPLSPKYVLLGFETGTVLALLATRKGYDIGSRGVNIYTSDMLDYI
ncbi:hypothetical protein Agabi119p4_5958 [Agaricus bisporus var. burnettii]|uniref:Uncharacterized protein n=1 Tax=Agaricus bisporus var. burnettii TaxID=192524 RepID=A0A8H7KG67_AGABI|nr:hypothetical protein Agabi119p4_5958 [Agaricus bisporus var. burnettii]